MGAEALEETARSRRDAHLRVLQADVVRQSVDSLDADGREGMEGSWLVKIAARRDRRSARRTWSCSRWPTWNGQCRVPGALEAGKHVEGHAQQEALVDDVGRGAEAGPVEAHVGVAVAVEVAGALEHVRLPTAWITKNR